MSALEKRTSPNRCLPNSMFYKAIIKDQKKLELKPGNLYQAALYALNACVAAGKEGVGSGRRSFSFFAAPAVVREDHSLLVRI